MSGIAVLLTVLAGLAGAVQVAVMGRFGGRIGVIEALTFSTAVQLLLSRHDPRRGARRRRRTGWRLPDAGVDVARGPDGVDGRLLDHLRAAAHRGDGDDRDPIAGQLVMGALIDRYGLFGVERIDISLPRALGIVLLGIGAGLSLVR